MVTNIMADIKPMLLDDGLWPTYSINKSFDREHTAEAFVVGATSSAFIVAYMEAREEGELSSKNWGLYG